MKNLSESDAFREYVTKVLPRLFQDTSNPVKDAKLTINGEAPNRGSFTIEEGYRRIEALSIKVRPSLGGLFTHKTDVPGEKKPEHKPGSGFTKK